MAGDRLVELDLVPAVFWLLRVLDLQPVVWARLVFWAYVLIESLCCNVDR